MKWGIDMHFNFKENNVEGTLQFDNIVIASNEEYGYRPYELFVSSIAGCSGLVFKRILMKQKTEFETFTIDAEVERNKDKANRIEKIILHFKIKGKDLNEKKLQRNLNISRKHCAMIQSIENSIEVVERLSIDN